MIQTELLLNGSLIRHYSDENMMIKQVETNILYVDAVDWVPCPYAYEETDIPIEIEEENLMEEN